MSRSNPGRLASLLITAIALTCGHTTTASAQLDLPADQNPMAQIAPADPMLASGSEQSLWVIQSADDRRFDLLHRRAEFEDPDAMYEALLSVPGQPIALTVWRDQACIFYEDLTVQAVIHLSEVEPGMPRYRIRQLPPLPTGVTVLDVTADRDGPWALLSWPPVEPEDESEATKSADATADETSDSSPHDQGRIGPHGLPQQNEPTDSQSSNNRADANATEAQPNPAPQPEAIDTAQAPAADNETGPDTRSRLYRLLHLEGSEWIRYRLPEQVAAEAHPMRLIVNDNNGTSIGLIHRTRIDADHLTRFQRNEDGTWHSEEYDLALQPRVEVTSVRSQAVLATGTASGDQLSLYILRQGRAIELASLSQPRIGLSQWSITSYRDLVTLVFFDATSKLAWAQRDLSAATDQPLEPRPLEVKPWPAWQPDSYTLVLMGMLMVGMLILLAGWRQQGGSSPLELPGHLVIAEPPRRALAAIIDITPAAIVSMAVFNLASPLELFANWPGKEGDWQTTLPAMLTIVLMVVHTTISEMIAATSLGKRLLSMRIVTDRGRKPRAWQILVRNLMKVMEMVAFLLLIFPFLSPLRQRLGDMVARTVVVDITESAEEEQAEKHPDDAEGESPPQGKPPTDPGE
jgi:uncharacterized RDD family membrane protein YckC